MPPLDGHRAGGLDGHSNRPKGNETMSADKPEWRCSKHGTKGEPACPECHDILTRLFEFNGVIEVIKP